MIVSALWITLTISFFVAIVIILVCQLWFNRFGSDNEVIFNEQTDDNDEPRIVTDPGKAFCKQVKFMVRLKRRMRDFKAKKDQQNLTASS